MVEWAFGKFPDLRLSVQRFVFNETADGSGGRLAMEFRESATSPKHGRGGSWPGISLYRFHDDGRLLSVEVEQDFWGRLDQLEGRAAGRPMAPTDPSVWTAEPQPANVETEAMVREWLGDPAAYAAAMGDASIRFDDGEPLAVQPEQLEIADLFTAGWRFALKARLHGRDVRSGGNVVLAAAGVGSIDADGRADVCFATDRFGAVPRV